MALSDWEIILGGGLVLSDKYKVSGSKSLSQGFNGGATHIVHKSTYNDAPLNVQIDTWMTVGQNDDCYYYHIGGIARKQPDVRTYLYWDLVIRIRSDTTVDLVDLSYGYYENGTQNELNCISFEPEFKNALGDTWSWGSWRYVRMYCYESGGKITIYIGMTPDIANPDPSNPPTDQIKDICSVTFNTPDCVKNGGACGLIVGGVECGYATIGQPFYDYTQIYY